MSKKESELKTDNQVLTKQDLIDQRLLTLPIAHFCDHEIRITEVDIVTYKDSADKEKEKALLTLIDENDDTHICFTTSKVLIDNLFRVLMANKVLTNGKMFKTTITKSGKTFNFA